jgi:hypothetical protein
MSYLRKSFLYFSIKQALAGPFFYQCDSTKKKEVEEE